MTTVKDMIDSALRLAGILGEGTSLTYNEYADALYALNAMIDSWSTDKYKIFTTQRLSFPLVVNQQQYGLGIGGSFNAPRPARVDLVSMEIPTGVVGVPAVEIPVNMLTVESWQTLTPKATPSLFPTDIYISNTAPINDLFVWPIPTAVNNIILYVWGLLPNYYNLTDIIELPKGYVHALEFNLCLMLCPEYGKEPLPAVMRNAAQSLNALANINHTTQLMRCDPAILGKSNTFNIALASRGFVVD